MDSLTKTLLASLLLVLVAFVEETMSDAMVTGTVFCDQCKDGQRSLFDYPLSGRKVRVTCDSIEKEETTNWFGSYSIRFEGSPAPDLSRCYAHLLLQESDRTANCGAAAGPAQQLRLMFRMFDMEMYAVDSLLSQPAQPTASICPRTATNPPPPATPSLPPSHPSPPTPTHAVQASACTHEVWTRPEYRCHWRFVHPDTKVAVAFGLIAAARYGTDISLWQGIQGRGDIYRTLLREGTTALLNSYNSLQFGYPTLSVLNHMNWALMGNSRQALLTALRFKRANSGYHNTTSCNLTPCRN